MSAPSVRPVPARPPVARIRRVVLLAIVLALSAVAVFAAMLIASAAPAPAPPPSDGGAATGAPAASIASAEVTGDEVVVFDGASVETACFGYSLPDVGDEWVLSDGRGCATAVVPATGDQMTQFVVRGIRESGDLRSIAETVAAKEGATGGTVLSIEEARIGGRDVATVTVDVGMGLRLAIRVVPAPDPRLTSEGRAIGALTIASYDGPWHRGVATEIIASLRAPVPRASVGTRF